MTEEVFQKDMAIYEIKITEIPEKEQPDFMEDLEKKIEVDVLEVKHDDSLDMRNIIYSIGFVSPKYAKGNDVIRVYIKALSDETASKEVSEKTMILDGIYEHLNERFDRIFSRYST